ncbi:MAG TPA: hypothetical protein VJV04_06750 [Nitrospiraceae bacterium]|nr:hypothetical protein [Nitrospiraceae bacterium]
MTEIDVGIVRIVKVIQDQGAVRCFPHLVRRAEPFDDLAECRMARHNEGHIFRNNRVIDSQSYKATAYGPARRDRYHGGAGQGLMKSSA